MIKPGKAIPEECLAQVTYTHPISKTVIMNWKSLLNQIACLRVEQCYQPGSQVGTLSGKLVCHYPGPMGTKHGR